MNPLIVITCVQFLYEHTERDAVFNKARMEAARRGKPLLNAGCGSIKVVGGFTRAIMESDVNLDIVPREVPRFVLGDVQRIPYPDKFFGAAFCCHVLEHIDNLEQGMSELDRVADSVFTVVPRPVWPSTWLHPGHKRVFFGDTVQEI